MKLVAFIGIPTLIKVTNIVKKMSGSDDEDSASTASTVASEAQDMQQMIDRCVEAVNELQGLRNDFAQDKLDSFDGIIDAMVQSLADLDAMVQSLQLGVNSRMCAKQGKFKSKLVSTTKNPFVIKM